MSNTALQDTTFIDASSVTDQDVHAWMAGAPAIQAPDVSASPALSVTVLDGFNQRKAQGTPGEDLYLCRVAVGGQPIGDVYVDLRGEGRLAAAGRDYLFANRPA